MTNYQIKRIRQFIHIISKVGADPALARMYLQEMLAEFKATPEEAEVFLAELQLVLGTPKKRPRRSTSIPTPASLVDSSEPEPIGATKKPKLNK